MLLFQPTVWKYTYVMKLMQQIEVQNMQHHSEKYADRCQLSTLTLAVIVEMSPSYLYFKETSLS